MIEEKDIVEVEEEVRKRFTEAESYISVVNNQY